MYYQEQINHLLIFKLNFGYIVYYSTNTDERVFKVVRMVLIWRKTYLDFLIM